MDSPDKSLPTEAGTQPAEKQVWGPWISAAFGLTVIGAFSMVSVVTVIAFFLLNMTAGRGFGLSQLVNIVMSQIGLVVAIATIASAIVCIPLVALFVKLRRSGTFAEYVGLRRFRFKSLLFWLAITLGILVLSATFSFLVIKPPDDGIIIRIYATSVWPPLFWVAVIIFAPAFEELLFRGFLFEGFRRSRMGNTVTILLMAGWWALLHIGTYGLFGLSEIFVLGLALGIARLKTDSLWVPLSMHAFANLVAMVELTVFVSLGVVALQVAPVHGERIVLQSDLTGLSSVQAERTLDASTLFIRSRLGERGVTDFDVRRTGQNQIIVRVPENTTIPVLAVIRASVRPNYLEFGEPAGPDEAAVWEDPSGRWKPAFGTVSGPMLELTSKYFLGDTSVTMKKSGRAALNFEWDDTGRQLAEQITARLDGKPLAIFEGNHRLLNQQGEPIELFGRDVAGASGVIDGLAIDEAKRLSAQVNASRLMRGIRIVKIEDY